MKVANEMDRRHFFRVLGATGAAAAVAAAGAGSALADEAPAAGAIALGDAAVNFSQEVDVLVCGAGISGMMCAYETASAGLTTLIAEQNGFYGGDAIYSAACMMCNTARLTQEERPEKYSTIDELRERFAPYYENDEAGLDQLMLLQEWGGKWMDLMHYDWGYEFQPQDREGPYQQAFFPQGRPVHHGGRVRRSWTSKVTEAGADLPVRAPPSRPLIADEAGAVVGRALHRQGRR